MPHDELIELPFVQAYALTGRGWWFVRYDDGGVTHLMDRKEAKLLAEIFGGVVVKHSKAPPWWKFWVTP